MCENKFRIKQVFAQESGSITILHEIFLYQKLHVLVSITQFWNHKGQKIT